MLKRTVPLLRRGQRLLMRLSGLLQTQHAIIERTREMNDSIERLSARMTTSIEHLNAQADALSDRLTLLSGSMDRAFSTGINNVHNIQHHQLNLLLEILQKVEAPGVPMSATPAFGSRAAEKENSILAEELDRLDGYLVHHNAVLLEAVRGMRADLDGLRAASQDVPGRS